jgi:YHS domain-containing protein
MAGEQLSWRERLTSARAWSDVAHNFRGDWQMLWKEITLGFLLAGFIAQLGNDFFNGLFVKDAPGVITTVENVIVGPLIAVLSFVCSVGNVPLAAVLWSGGISFAGVMAFIFADLIVLPILAIYRKYYGWHFAARITALMLVTMMLAALAIDGLFGLLGLIPSGARPTRGDIFGSIQVDYKLALNALGLVVFGAMFWLTARRGATDVVCGMKVDRAKAITKTVGNETYYLCSKHCLHTFEADPDRYTHRGKGATSVAPLGREATDPVCGMTVDPDRALRSRRGDRQYFFCSPRCQHAFDANPDAYTAEAASATESSEQRCRRAGPHRGRCRS